MERGHRRPNHARRGGVGHGSAGATGDMAAFSTGNRGGPVSVKLLPTSPSVAFFMQQAEVMRRGLGGVERQHPQRAAEHQRDVDPGG